MLQKACDDPALRGWLSSDQDSATMGTPEVQAVFDLLYAFRVASNGGAHAIGHGPAIPVWTSGDEGVSVPGPHRSAGPRVASP